jgi:hypothetical protein
MMMPVKRATALNRRQNVKEWLVFFRNGLTIAFVAAVVLFWDSPHSADEIAVTIAVPLIIFNCIPFFLQSLATLLPQPPQNNLSLAEVQLKDFKTLPGESRRNAPAIVAIISMIICFFGSGAIFLASFTYSYFGVSWAVTPARHLSYLLFALTSLPVVAVISFVAGMVYSGKIRNSALAALVYLKALQPLSHWPTFA